jgi:hypothetical protein
MMNNFGCLFFLKMIFKLASLVINIENLVNLRKTILQEEENISDEDLQIEKKYRKLTRIIHLLLVMNYSFAGFFTFVSPIFAKDKFAMPLYVQLPGT